MNDMLAQNLAFLLKGDKATQTAVAQQVGVGQPTISKWSKLAEIGSPSEPEFRKMALLARAMRVSLDDLAWRDLENDPPASASQSAGLDVDKLATLIETVEAAVERSGRRVPARTKARLLTALYRDDQASAASSAQAVQAALASILATMEET
jgi:transcriptional regulator with XRE-family HTH domain